MKTELFDELTQSIREGGAIARAEAPASRAFDFSSSTPDVARLRAAQGMTLREFAEILGVTPATVRRWEKSGHVPGGSTRVLLRLVEKHSQLLRAVASDEKAQRRNAN